MAANEKPQERSTQESAALLESLTPGLSAASLAEVGRQEESLDSVMFAFNPWQIIPNVDLKGFRFGVHHVVLPRMSLIPLVTWKNPEFIPRTQGFALAVVTPSGSFPGGNVGSKIETRLQFPSKSAQILLEAYGDDGANDIGFRVLRSLTADSDTGKIESVLLFRALMETALDSDVAPGSQWLLEHLPTFLRDVAPLLLKRAIVDGVDVQGRAVKLPTRSRAKGERLLAELQSAIAGAHRRALDQNTGILPFTKSELIASGKGLKERKALPDKLDEWLLTQFPSFSLDTDVERAMRANQGVTNAIRESGQENATTLRDLLDMQRQTLDQLAAANALNRELMAQKQVEKPAA